MNNSGEKVICLGASELTKAFTLNNELLCINTKERCSFAVGGPGDHGVYEVKTIEGKEVLVVSDRCGELDCRNCFNS